MARGWGAVNFDGVCKCKNPKVEIIGYAGGFKKVPIYRCYVCLHQFKSNAKKWADLAMTKDER